MKELLFKPLHLPNPFPFCRNGLHAIWNEAREAWRDMRAALLGLPLPRWFFTHVPNPFRVCAKAWRKFKTAVSRLPWPKWFFLPIRVQCQIGVPSVEIPLLRHRKVVPWFDRLYFAAVIVALGCGVRYSIHSAWTFDSTEDCMKRAANSDTSAFPETEPWRNPRSAAVETMTRWDDLRMEMAGSAADDGEVEGVCTTARHELSSQMWPKIAWRGWLKGSPVWIIKAVWPQHSYDIPNTLLNQWNYKTVVISATAPYTLQGAETDNSPG